MGIYARGIKKQFNSFISNRLSNVIKKNSKIRESFAKWGRYAMECKRDIPDSEIYYAYQKYSVANILPETSIPRFHGANLISMDEICSLKNEKKIEVRLLFASLPSWNALDTVAEAFWNDDNYNMVVIYTEESKSRNKTSLDFILEKGYKVIRLEEYDISTDRPDVLVITNGSETRARRHEFLNKVNKYVRKVVLVETRLSLRDVPLDGDFIDFEKKDFEYCGGSCFFFDKLMYGLAKEKMGDSAIAAGNPKLDIIFRASKVSGVSDKWKKLQGKKVFLFATGHFASKGYFLKSDLTSIDEYIGWVFKYFYENKSLGLIVRFHPAYFDELCCFNGDYIPYWTLSDRMRVIDFCENSENIVWDDTPTYYPSFGISDALITDLNTGVNSSYLPTGKPICRYMRQKSKFTPKDEYEASEYYYARNAGEIEGFISNICNGIDEKSDDRKKAIDRDYYYFDGKNGERIKQKIENLLDR